MPHERPTTEDTAIHHPAGHEAATPVGARSAQAPTYAAVVADDDWLDEPGELPPRPRRRLLGTGTNPIALGLLAVLLIACGFIGGVLVEKGESSSSSAGSSLAARFATLRGGASGAGSRAGAGAAGGGFAGAFAGAGAGGTRPTTGTVAYLAGSTLYVTNAEGNTVKVSTSAATSVSKTIKANVPGIHPGETVTVTGTGGSGGAISAESISVGSSGGGLAALFGAAASGGSSGGGSGGGAAALFGSG